MLFAPSVRKDRGLLFLRGERNVITKPMDVLEQFPIRKTKKQKQAFRESVLEYAQAQGYTCQVEKGSMGSQNVIIGDAEKAKYLVTAHYDTPASLIIPNFITPCNFVVFLAYQFLIVGLFIAVAFLVGFTAGMITKNPELGGSIAGLFYWAILILMILVFLKSNKIMPKTINAQPSLPSIVTNFNIGVKKPPHLLAKL